MSRCGFTLIELMIVIAIIAIVVAIAIPNLMRSRMASNEAAAIGACKTYGTAQEMYRRFDWDNDGIREYAKNIGPNGKRGNGESLYFNIARNTTIELVDRAFAFAEGDPGAPGTSPKSGYVFRVQLDATWPSVRNYLDTSNNLTNGYGISAVPFAYGITGLNKFQLSSDGTVFQNNTGDNTHAISYDVNSASGWINAE